MHDRVGKYAQGYKKDYGPCLMKCAGAEMCMQPILVSAISDGGCLRYHEIHFQVANNPFELRLPPVACNKQEIINCILCFVFLQMKSHEEKFVLFDEVGTSALFSIAI